MKLIHYISRQRQSGTLQHILSCQLRSGIPKEVEAMIGDAIHTFRNTPSANNQKFVRNKSK